MSIVQPTMSEEDGQGGKMILAITSWQLHLLKGAKRLTIGETANRTPDLFYLGSRNLSIT
jgi:hypothetical protein